MSTINSATNAHRTLLALLGSCEIGNQRLTTPIRRPLTTFGVCWSRSILAVIRCAPTSPASLGNHADNRLDPPSAGCVLPRPCPDLVNGTTARPWLLALLLLGNISVSSALAIDYPTLLLFLRCRFIPLMASPRRLSRSGGSFRGRAHTEEKAIQ